MGADASTYIGAYIIAKDKVKEVEKSKTIYKNEKTDKVFKKPIKFDPDTGDPVTKVKEKYMEKIAFRGWYDLLEELDLYDELGEDGFFTPAYHDCPKGHSLMISNSDNGRLFDDVESEFTGEITASGIADTLLKFKGSHKKEIAALFDFYGEENVQIKFGIVNYAH